jgi:hypothetical protein
MGIALLIAIVWVWPPAKIPERINHASFEQLKKGMSRAAVLELLRVPPGKHVTESVRYVQPVNKQLVEELTWAPEVAEHEAVWEANMGRIVVMFDERDNITRKAFFPAAWDESFFTMVRRWAGF